MLDRLVQPNLVVSQQIGEPLVEPRLISHLHDKLHEQILHPDKERAQATEELIGLNVVFVEPWELQ